jgi:hypothetical protein
MELALASCSILLSAILMVLLSDTECIFSHFVDFLKLQSGHHHSSSGKSRMCNQISVKAYYMFKGLK